MANDNSSTDLAAQQEAMASEGGASGTTDTTDADGKVRKSPYYNCSNDILAMVDHTTAQGDERPEGLLQRWEKDPTITDETRETIVAALSFLAAKIVAYRDQPREVSEALGRHYVGIMADGARQHFKSTTTPSCPQAQCQNFKIVLGPYSTNAGAEYTVTNGRRAKDILVFHRTGTAKDLGARADYAAEVNAS